MHPAGDLGPAIGVGGPYGAAEAELAVVGDRDGLLLGVVGNHRQHRAEDLFLRDPRRVVDIGEDRRRDEPAVRLIGRNSAAGNEFRLRFTDVDIVEDPPALTITDQRTDVGGLVQRITHREPVGQGRHRVDHLGIP